MSINGDFGGAGFSSRSIADNNLGFSGGYGERFGGSGAILASAGGIALPLPGASVEDAGNVGRAGAGAGAAALGIGLMTYSTDAGRGSDSLTFYHGDRLDVAKSLLSGIPLTTENARDPDFGGPPGFYWTPQLEAAEYFAANRGFVLRYDIAFSAHQELIAAGATYSNFTIGKYGPAYMEFVIPAIAFPLFNSLQVSGQIIVSGPVTH